MAFPCSSLHWLDLRERRSEGFFLSVRIRVHLWLF
jgi:hypothetical protein